MAAGPVSTVVGDTKNRPLLRFDVRREVLAGALKSFSGRRIAAVEGDNGITFDIGMVLTPEERNVISANRTLRARLNKIVDRAGDRLVDVARRESRPTYRTGLFYSSWKTRKVESTGGLTSKLELTNAAPYALYVHRKGWRAPGQRSGWPTVVNRLIKPAAQRISEQIIDDLLNDRPLMNAIRDAVLARALGRLG